LSAGIIALALGASKRFLPHDEYYLGMTANELCALNGCRVVHFMVHDRVAFGGTLVAVGVLYLWLIEGPLRERRQWAWWTLALSGAEGFASFFAYLGYGYLDTWHGLATLALLPCFAAGLVRSYPAVCGSARRRHAQISNWASPTRAVRVGRVALLATGAGLAVAGVVIMAIGMTCVFVTQDTAFMGVRAAELDALNPRLVPLIAHDRAGFGGAVCCTGLITVSCAAFSRPTPGLWWTLSIGGTAGFGAAIGVHPAVGYDDALHLAPAVAGAFTFGLGLVLTTPVMFRRAASSTVLEEGFDDSARRTAVA
jgi:hypothetical protein